MFNPAIIFMLVCYLMILSFPSMANAKPSAPIDVDNITPKIIRIGEEVHSVLRFTAKTDLRHVKISLSPYSGVVLLSSKRHAEFTDLKRNHPRKIKIRIRLTEETGYLSVFATTTDMAGNTRTRSVAIHYTSMVEARNNRPSRQTSKNTAEERLILLPGSPR